MCVDTVIIGSNAENADSLRILRVAMDQQQRLSLSAFSHMYLDMPYHRALHLDVVVLKL